MKVGIFGGTFDPPHIGHITAAKEFISSMALDRLLVIPTFIPPHKIRNSSTTPEDRMEMCRIAFSKLEKASVSDLEIKRGGHSYTYLTLEELAHSGDELYLLCGTDMFLTLDTWKNHKRIFELAIITCIRRENEPEMERRIEEKRKSYENNFCAKIRFISSDPIEVSSTEVREAICSGDQTEKIPTDVLNYILNRRLYL